MNELNKNAAERKADECPLLVIGCIANGLQLGSGVDPWYDQIKEKSLGATFHDASAHKEVISGMYPELKEFCEEFRNKAKELTGNGIVGKHFEILMKINSRVLARKLNLKTHYDFSGQMNAEQKARVNNGLLKYAKSQIYDKYLPLPPALAEYGEMCMKDMNDVRSVLKFVNDLHIVSDAAKKSDAELADLRPDLPEYAEQFELADKYKELQRRGIVDEKGNVVDRKSFLKSDFMSDAAAKTNMAYKKEKNLAVR